MKIGLSHIICPIIAIAALAGGIVISIGELSKRAEINCGGIETVFNDSLKFVNEQDIKRIIAKQYGTFIGQRKDSVRLGSLERLLEQNCYIKNADLWMTDDGVLHARIDQRQPALLLRDAGFYCDRNMTTFPINKNWEAGVANVGGVPTVNGEELKELLQKILSIYDTIEGSELWKERIDSVYIVPGNELFMRCKGFDGLFIFGEPDDKERKLSAIEAFFDKILPEQTDYKSVNLKYKNQIICRKDI